MRYRFLHMVLLVVLSLYACAKEAPNVVPNPLTQSATEADTGTDRLRIIDVYPPDLASDIPVDTPIILVFNKPVDITTIDEINVAVDTVTGFDPPSAIAGGNTILIENVTPGFANGTTYNININTSAIYENGNPANTLENTWSSSFTTAIIDTPVPMVIPVTRYPTGTNVSVDTNYAEVTFSTAMNFSTIDTTSFSISPDPGMIDTTQVDSNTYRLNFTSPLAASTVYTVTLTSAIEDLDTPGNPLTINAYTTWSFTTEASPDPGTGSVVNSVWVSSSTSTSATIYFTTDSPVDRNDCYIIYDTGPGFSYSSLSAVETDWDADGNNLHTLHMIDLTGLTRSQAYYYRIWIDSNSDSVVDEPPGPPVDLFSTEYAFATKTDTTAGINEILADSAGDQSAFKKIQVADGSSYIFWVDTRAGNDDIYGQYFSSSGAAQWGADGAAVGNNALSHNNIVALGDGFSDAIVLYKEGNSLYGKMVYDNSGSAGFRWGGAAGSQGVSLGITALAGSNYSAVMVEDNTFPLTLVTGIADMPDDGAPANLLFDNNVNFSGIGFLSAGDLFLTNTGGINWTVNNVANQNAAPADIYNYVLKSDANTSLGVYTNYYLADVDSNVINANSDNSNTTTTRICSSTNLTSVSAGDIIKLNLYNEWGRASLAGYWDGFLGCYRVNIDRALTSLAQNEDFIIYRNHSGPYTSEAEINPLWDDGPSAVFDPGVNVMAGDIVVNERDNINPATKTLVSAINGSDFNYALQLDDDIMDDGDEYAIVSIPPSSSYVAVGYSTSIPLDYELDDINAAFQSGNATNNVVSAGDMIYNIDQDVTAKVLSVNSETQLTLSADIFNASNDKYIIYSRSFFVAYIDASSHVLGGHFSASDGSAINASMTVDAVGTFSNPFAVSDGDGSVMVFYQGGANVYGRSIRADDGSLNWSQTYGDLSSNFIVQALPDGAGGAYILGSTGFGSITVLRINGSTGALTPPTPIATLTGYTPRMTVDSVFGNPDRIIITYLVLHNDGFNDYAHISVAGYNGNGSVAITPYNVTSNTVSYNCLSPRITIADTATVASSYYISWFDGRFYSSSGYALYANQYNSAGTAQWGSGVFVTTPTSYGLSGELYMELLYYDDDAGTDPFGVMPLWLDRRDYITTGIDIYYELVQDNGTY